MRSSIFYRATWLANCLWKILFALSIPAGFYYGLQMIPGPRIHAVLFSLGAILVMGGGATFFISRVIALPVQVLLDLIHAFMKARSTDRP